MGKRIVAVVFLVIFSMASTAVGFDNNPNKINPSVEEDKRQRPYTRENATKPVDKNNWLQGGFYGGHDTITNEAMQLKQQVHDDNDFSRWAEQALPSLRIGAHDEDSTKIQIDVPLELPDANLNITYPVEIHLDEPPIGNTGWGGWFHHFYNPKTGKGLKGFGTPAPNRAKDYIAEIKKIAGCTPGGVNNLSAEKKKKAYEYFGKTMHLLQDMAVPSHTQDNAKYTYSKFQTIYLAEVLWKKMFV
jgi:hypothetical protein